MNAAPKPTPAGSRPSPPSANPLPYLSPLSYPPSPHPLQTLRPPPDGRAPSLTPSRRHLCPNLCKPTAGPTPARRPNAGPIAPSDRQSRSPDHRRYLHHLVLPPPSVFQRTMKRGIDGQRHSPPTHSNPTTSLHLSLNLSFSQFSSPLPVASPPPLLHLVAVYPFILPLPLGPALLFQCQAGQVISELFTLCPNAKTAMEVATEEIEKVIQTLVLQRKRAVMIQRFSQEYLGELGLM